jgi:hypothetical protein
MSRAYLPLCLFLVSHQPASLSWVHGEKQYSEGAVLFCSVYVKSLMPHLYLSKVYPGLLVDSHGHNLSMDDMAALAKRITMDKHNAL